MASGLMEFSEWQLQDLTGDVLQQMMDSGLGVSLSGSLHVGGAEGFAATVSGTVNVDSSQLSVQHPGGWSPLPGNLSEYFVMPAFYGTVDFNVNGVNLAMACHATWVAPITLLPGMFEIVAPPSSTASGAQLSVSLRQEATDSDYEWSVKFEGGVYVGGESPTGFLASLSGSINTAEGSASLAIEHAGGWSPLPGNLFVTPAFSGTADFNVDGLYLKMSCEVLFPSGITLVPDMIAFVPHPLTGVLGVDILLTKPTADASYSFAVGFEGGLQLASWLDIPVIGVEGTLSLNGESLLHLMMLEDWTPPLPSVLSGLTLPRFNGTIFLNRLPTLPLPSISLPEVIRLLRAKFPAVPWPEVPNMYLHDLSLPDMSLSEMALAYPSMSWPDPPQTMGLPVVLNVIRIALPNLAWPKMPSVVLPLPSILLPTVIALLRSRFPSFSWPEVPSAYLLDLSLPDMSLSELALAYPSMSWPDPPQTMGLPVLVNLMRIGLPDLAWPVTMPDADQVEWQWAEMPAVPDWQWLDMPALADALGSVLGAFDIPTITSLQLIPGMFELSDLEWNMDIPTFYPNSNLPSFRLSMCSDVDIGGDDGFEARICGAVDMEAKTASLSIVHPGGWSAP